MKVGDLVQVKDCEQLYDVIHPFYKICSCWFCKGKSSRIGIVSDCGHRNQWVVTFDCGEWRTDDFGEARGEIKVINEIT